MPKNIYEYLVLLWGILNSSFWYKICHMHQMHLLKEIKSILKTDEENWIEYFIDHCVATETENLRKLYRKLRLKYKI